MSRPESFASSATRTIIRLMSTQEPIWRFQAGISASSQVLRFRPCAAEILRSLIHQSGLCSCLCGAAGCYEDDVVLRAASSSARRGRCPVVPWGCCSLPWQLRRGERRKRTHSTSGLVVPNYVYLKAAGNGIQRALQLPRRNNRPLPSRLLARNMYKIRLTVLEVLDCHLYDSLCILAAFSGLKRMNSASGICAIGEVVTNLVWKHLTKPLMPGKYTERQRRLPHRLRSRTSFLLLQEVTCPSEYHDALLLRWMQTDTGNRDALRTHLFCICDHLPDHLHTHRSYSESDGSCPCTTIFTFFSVRRAEVCTRLSSGSGVPNSTSENSVPAMDPPHPSESPDLKD